MIKVIKTDEQYQEYLDRYREVKGTDEGDLLLVLIADYQDRTYPLQFHDMCPVEIIKERMRQMGLKGTDMYKGFIDKNTFNKVINRKAKISLIMIRRFSEILDLPIDLLVKDYELTQ